MVNFYDLLGVSSNATTPEIIKAYKQKAKKFHPDVNDGSEASDAMFKLIALAKDTLIDPQKRLNHDYNTGVKKKPNQEPKRESNQEDNIGKMVSSINLDSAPLNGAGDLLDLL